MNCQSCTGIGQLIKGRDGGEWWGVCSLYVNMINQELTGAVLSLNVHESPMVTVEESA